MFKAIGKAMGLGASDKLKGAMGFGGGIGGGIKKGGWAGSGMFGKKKNQQSEGALGALGQAGSMVRNIFGKGEEKRESSGMLEGKPQRTEDVHLTNRSGQTDPRIGRYNRRHGIGQGDTADKVHEGYEGFQGLVKKIREKRAAEGKQ